MKNIKIVLGLLILALFHFGCEDKSELTQPSAPTVNTGSVNFTTMVSIGNSITAGFQSNALFEGGQIYSFGNLISKQIGVTYQQPLYTEPGYAGAPGRMYFGGFVGSSVSLIYKTATGSNKNATYSKVYNNLGIPGAVLFDVLDTTGASTNFVSKSTARQNPYFASVLRNKSFGTSVYNQTKALNPGFITCWIGNNDVLGFATSGGVSPSDPTPSTTFGALYSQMGDSLATLNSKVVLLNIPDVTAIPFFTTVGPSVAVSLPTGISLSFQKRGEGAVASGVASAADLLSGKHMITLKGSTYAPYLGTPSGKFYKDNNIPLPTGIDTTKPFGFHPQNPWPNALMLDSTEIVIAKNAITAFNTTIAGVANAKGFGLVDINTIFNSFKGAGKTVDGLVFTTSFISGGLFSLDGVHPSSAAHGIIANEIINVVNAKWGAAIPLINVSTLPGSLTFSKKLSFNKNNLPEFPKEFFDNILF